MKKDNIDFKVNYKIDPNLKITTFSGFKIFRQAVKSFSVFEKLGNDFGMKSRNKKYREFDYFSTLMANLVTGGTVIDDVMRFQKDKVFQKIFGFTKGIPQSSAIYKFLGKAHPKAIEKFRNINRKTLLSILNKVYKGRKAVVRVLCFMDSSEGVSGV